MEDKIITLISSVIKKHDAEIISHSPLVNTLMSFTILLPRVENYSANKFYDDIKTLPFFSCFTTTNFRMGKKETGKSQIFIQISVTEDFDNGVINDNNCGKFLSFVRSKNINSAKDFMNNTIGYIKNMSNICHLDIDRGLKKEYRKIKKNYLKFLYLQGLVDNVEIQISYCNDILALFTVGDTTFHLRAFSVDFISEIDALFHYNQTLEVIDFIIPKYKGNVNKEIYQKKSVNSEDIDLSFKEFIEMLRHINNRVYFNIAKINLK